MNLLSRRALRISPLFIPAVLFLGLLTDAEAQEKPARIGVIVDGESDYLNAVAQKFRSETEALTAGEFTIEVKEEKIIRCKFDRPCLKAGLDTLLSDPEVDIVIAHGTLASAEAIGRKRFEKPVLAPFVLDPRAQGLTPERAPKNLGYFLWASAIGTELKQLSRLSSFDRAYVILSESLLVGDTSALKTHLESEAKRAGKSVVLVPTGPTAKEALAAVPADAQVVYVGPLLDMPYAERKLLAQGLAERKILSSGWLGEVDVEMGFLAGTTPKGSDTRLARRFALAIQSLLLGESPESVSSTVRRENKLFLNGPLSVALGLSPLLSSLLETKVIGGDGPSGVQHDASIGPTLPLRRAVEIALAQNLSLKAAEYGVTASGHEARRARSPLLPQVTASAEARAIDADRAFGTNQELQASWTAKARQSLFDERAWGGYSAAKHGVRAQEEEKQSIKLDVISRVATAYLNLLQARTLEKNQAEDLRLSQENLDLARVREQVGQAGREEVFRWESRIAESRRNLLEAIANQRVSLVDLNILMNRSAEESLVPEEIHLGQKTMLAAHPHFTSYLESPKHLAVLQDFLVQEGLLRAPELRGLVEQAAGIQRTVNAEKRSYFLPSVGVEGLVNHRFAHSDVAPLGVYSPDDLDWQVGIAASLPLFEGGLKDANVQKGNAQIGQLTLQKQDLARAIEGDVRRSLYRAAASYAAIDIAYAAEKAAQGNLGIVQDKYQRGRSTILELLDAQNEFIIAQNESANSVFVFLADVVTVERSMGRFSFFESEADTQALFARLSAFTIRQGVTEAPLSSDTPSREPKATKTAPAAE